jgi:RNA polymerase sigma factor for flagellar operon FliA
MASSMSPSRHDAHPLQAADSPEVRERIEQALALVAQVVGMLKTHLSGRARRDDLTSYGNEGALAAARTYDAGHGVPFASWARIRIRGAIIDGLRTEADLPRRLYDRLRAIEAASFAHEGLELDDAGMVAPLSPQAADARIEDRLTAMATAYAAGLLMARDKETLETIEDGRGTPEEELAREELKATIRAAVAERPEAERVLLERYYFDEMTMAEASGGLSRSWASRLHARAIGGVARSLRKANQAP